MYDTIVSVIESGHYELADMLNKIDTLWVQGDLTDEQREYLVTRANENAQLDAQYKPLQEQMNKAFEQIAELTIRVAKLENAGSGEDPDPEDPEPSEDEYPEWYAWNGVGNIPWQSGSKCTHNGKKWISQVDNNIWEPGGAGVHETIWSMVEEEETEDPDPTDPEDPEKPEDPDTPSTDTEEWPEFVQPTAETPYHKGDKVTYNGKHYVSLIDNNTWSPDGYPAGWQEVKEKTEPEQEV